MSSITASTIWTLHLPIPSPLKKKPSNLEPTAGPTNNLRDHTTQEQDLLNVTAYRAKS
jgi:hypothetical protein